MVRDLLLFAGGACTGIVCLVLALMLNLRRWK